MLNSVLKKKIMPGCAMDRHLAEDMVQWSNGPSGSMKRLGKSYAAQQLQAFRGGTSLELHVNRYVRKVHSGF
jgi:hypothetical protein